MSLLYDPAALLAHLIEHGFAPAPLIGLPPEWQAAFAAVRRVTGTRADRQAAFELSIASSEYADNIRKQLAFVEKTPTRRYPRELRTADDLLTAQAAPDWCVEGLFTRPSLNLLVGPPGAKKTLLSLDLAVCVALGKPWLARPTRQSPVLFLDEETGLPQLWPRLQAALRTHRAPAKTPLNFVALPRFDLRHYADCDELQEMVWSSKAEFVVIDALADITSSASENSAKSMQPIFANLRRIAQNNKAAILVIHHTNKAGGYRGSTAISAGVDLLLSVESAHNSPLVKVDPQKGRSFLPNSFVARVDFTGDQAIFSLSREKRVRRLSKNHAAVLDLIAEHGPATFVDLYSRLIGKDHREIRRYVYDLQQRGFLERDEFGGNPVLFSLTPKGRHHLNLANERHG